jgi:hypothetical protein
MRFLSMKRTIVAAVAALALGVAALGVVGAQQGQSKPTPSRSGNGQWEQRHQQYVEAVAKRLNLDADRVKKAMEEARQEVGWGKPGGHRGGHGHGIRGLEIAARVLNMDVNDLRQQLTTRSLADIAGPRREAVANALKDEANKRIDEAVRANRLTADKAREMKQRLDQRIDEMMTKTWPARGQKQGPRGGPRQ